MDVGMKLELLRPGVKHAEASDFGTETGNRRLRFAVFLRWREIADRRSVFCFAGPGR